MKKTTYTVYGYTGNWHSSVRNRPTPRAGETVEISRDADNREISGFCRRAHECDLALDHAPPSCDEWVRYRLVPA